MKRLFIDLEKCYKCKECSVECSYYYHRSKLIGFRNFGFEKILVKAAQYLVCRRCEERFCVNSCPKEALEKSEDGTLIRHLFRCVSCKCCSVACPFGVIYPGILKYVSSMCDYCEGRLPPLCVETCKEHALEYREVDEKEKDVYFIDDKLAVHMFSFNAKRELK